MSGDDRISTPSSDTAGQLDGWQPIETGPKDREIDLWWPPIFSTDGDGKAMPGRFRDDRYAAKPKPYWTRADERLCGLVAVRKNQPTHWRERPAGPAALSPEDRP